MTTYTGGIVTLRFWHGGHFVDASTRELVYLSGRGRTFKFDPDELCYFDIMKNAKTCGDYASVAGLFYLIPGLGLREGLRKVVDDSSVREMGQLAMKYTTIDILFSKGKEIDTQKGPTHPTNRIVTRSSPAKVVDETEKTCQVPSSSPLNRGKSSTVLVEENDTNTPANPKSPRKDSHLNYINTNPTHEENFLETYDLIDPRPESPLKFHELVCQFSEDTNDPLYVPGDGKSSESEEFGPNFDEFEVEENDDEVLGEDDVSGELDNSDEELHVARQRDLQQEVAAGRLNSKNSSGLEIREITSNQKDDGYESEYFDSDADMETPPASDDETDAIRRPKRSTLVSQETDFTKFEWKAGQRFANREDFKHAVAKYSIMQGRNVHVVVSNKSSRQELGVRQFKSTWVAKEMLEVFKARPHWPAAEIVDTIKRAYKVLVLKSFAYRVKYNAHKLLHDSMQEHYQKLGRLKRGRKEGCGKINCVDTAFLKTFLGGQILAAVGRDANEQMLPITWAVVEGENNMSWNWFFTHLKSCLDLGDGKGAILNVVATVLPKAEHRHCARHIFAHWHRKFRGDEMKIQFWKIAKSYSISDHNEAMEELTAMNPIAATPLKAYNPQCFFRAYMDPTINFDAFTNNMAETFNGYIINARTKHIIYMMEDIRVSLMKRMVTKRQDMEKQASLLCPRIQSMLEKEKDKAAYCEVIPSTDTIFNVIHNLDQEAETFVDDCYKREVYLRTYAGSIPPITGERHWPMVEYNLYPPPIKVGPGRHRKNGIKDPFEDPKKPGKLSRHGMEMTCTLCKSKGHNKRGCPQKDTVVPSEPPPKKARGRPRKDAATTSTIEATRAAINYHSVIAHPTQLRRSGRMILTGEEAGEVSVQGAEEGEGLLEREGGRIGVGVMFASDDTPFTSVNAASGEQRLVNAVTNMPTQSSQTSTIMNQSQ
ncbi:Leucine--tRNA ligase [Bienertia sinuspersici]